MLRKVLEWCEHHRNDPATATDEDADNRKKTTDIEEWDQKFMQVDQEMLFEIILVCTIAPRVLLSAITSQNVTSANAMPLPGVELSRHQAPS